MVLIGYNNAPLAINPFSLSLASQSQDFDYILEESGTIISIGNASDVFVDVQCLLEDGGTIWQWHIFPSFTPILPTNLNPPTTSYNESSGLLRVFTSFIEEYGQDGRLNLQCLERVGTRTLSAVLTIVLGKNHFFVNSDPQHCCNLATLPGCLAVACPPSTLPPSLLSLLSFCSFPSLNRFPPTSTQRTHCSSISLSLPPFPCSKT